MVFEPRGLATGIGSLPYIDADPALSLIFANMPEIPHWPQLPQRGGAEGFVYQFLSPLVKAGLIVIDQEKVFFDNQNPRWPQNLADFYSLYLAVEQGDMGALENFALPHEAATGFFAFMETVKLRGPGEAVYFKGHLAGPLTIGMQLKDAGGRLSYYEDQLRDLIVKTLALHARWQAIKLAGLGRPAIIFVDEPAIGVCGSSSCITITRDMVISDINEIFNQIHMAGALAGVHSCDAIDWSILYQSSVDIVNLDVYNYGHSLIPFAAEQKSYIERGGLMAWGIVPTNEDAYGQTEDSLLAILENLWHELEFRGISRQRLLRQSLITPACGTGLLELRLAEHIYKTNAGLARRLQGMVK